MAAGLRWLGRPCPPGDGRSGGGRGGAGPQGGGLLPQVASGDEVLTVAITEPEASWGPQGVRLAPQRRDGGYVLSGVKLFAPDAVAATRIAAPARPGAGGG